MHRRGKLHDARLLGSIVLLAGSVEAQQTTPYAPPADLQVTLNGNDVTMKARNVVVQDVLEEISRQNGLVVVAHEPLERRLTLEILSLPLPEALRRILRHQSYTFQQAQQAPGRLWLFSSGPAPASLKRDAADASGDVDVHEVVMSLSRAAANDPAVRLEAVSSLAISGSVQAAMALSVAALNDEDAAVREEAVHALGETGDRAGRQILEQAILDSDNGVREAAVKALADLGGDDSALALAAVLSDEDPSLRQDVVHALAEIGGETAMGMLRQAAVDPHIAVSEAAVEALAEFFLEEEP